MCVCVYIRSISKASVPQCLVLPSGLLSKTTKTISQILSFFYIFGFTITRIIKSRWKTPDNFQYSLLKVVMRSFQNILECGPGMHNETMA